MSQLASHLQIQLPAIGHERIWMQMRFSCLIELGGSQFKSQVRMHFLVISYLPYIHQGPTRREPRWPRTRAVTQARYAHNTTCLAQPNASHACYNVRLCWEALVVLLLSGLCYAWLCCAPCTSMPRPGLSACARVCEHGTSGRHGHLRYHRQACREPDGDRTRGARIAGRRNTTTIAIPLQW